MEINCLSELLPNPELSLLFEQDSSTNPQKLPSTPQNQSSFFPRQPSPEKPQKDEVPEKIEEQASTGETGVEGIEDEDEGVTLEI